MRKSNLPEQFNKIIAQINEKNPYYLLIGVLVLMFVLDYLLVVQFQLGVLNKLNPKVTAKAQELTEAKKNIEQMGVYVQQVKALKEKRNQVSYRIKTKEEIPLILEHISRTANKHGVKVEQMMPSTSSQKEVMKNNEGKYYSVPISVEAVSGYHQLGRFLNDLEFGEEYLAFPRLSVFQNSANPGQHNVDLTIMAVIFEKT